MRHLAAMPVWKHLGRTETDMREAAHKHACLTVTLSFACISVCGCLLALRDSTVQATMETIKQPCCVQHSIIIENYY